jgi:hypothetical protein
MRDIRNRSLLNWPANGLPHEVFDGFGGALPLRSLLNRAKRRSQ